MRLFLLLMLVFSSFFVKAQLFNKFEQGYYYSINNEKITGRIDKDASAKRAFTSKNYIFFKTDTGRVRLSPDMLKSFVIGLDSFTVSHGTNAKFYQVVMDDSLKIFSERTFTIGGPTMSFGAGGGFGMVGGGGSHAGPPTYFYGLDADHLTELTKKNFVEVMSAIVADEPYLVDQVKDKTYRLGDIQLLIQVYKQVKSRTKNRLIKTSEAANH